MQYIYIGLPMILLFAQIGKLVFVQDYLLKLAATLKYDIVERDILSAILDVNVRWTGRDCVESKLTQ